MASLHLLFVIILSLKATKRLETNNIVMYAQIKYFFCKYTHLNKI